MKQSGLRVAVLSGCLTPQAVDRAVARGGDDPSGRARRDPAARPPPEGLDEGVLDRLLGDVDVTESADQDSNRPPVFLTEDSLDVCGVQSSASSWNGLTSIGTRHA
jgi:hypothetical protein